MLAHLKSKGLGATGRYPVPLDEQEGVAPYLKSTESYPIAKFISERILTLPLHEYITLSDVERIAKIMGGQ